MNSAKDYIMKSIFFLALLLIGCNSQQRNESQTYTVSDSVVVSLNVEVIPPQMKRTVAITYVSDFSISFTTADNSFIDIARKYGTVFRGVNPTPDYDLFVDDRYDIVEVAEYLKHEAKKRND